MLKLCSRTILGQLVPIQGEALVKWFSGWHVSQWPKIQNPLRLDTQRKINVNSTSESRIFLIECYISVWHVANSSVCNTHSLDASHVFRLVFTRSGCFNDWVPVQFEAASATFTKIRKENTGCTDIWLWKLYTAHMPIALPYFCMFLLRLLSSIIVVLWIRSPHWDKWVWSVQAFEDRSLFIS